MKTNLDYREFEESRQYLVNNFFLDCTHIVLSVCYGPYCDYS
jgi:hypothetical protein